LQSIASEINGKFWQSQKILKSLVNIGDGCEIDLVEYKTDFKKTPGASVLKHVKV